MDLELCREATSDITSFSSIENCISETLEKNNTLHVVVKLNQKHSVERIINLHPLFLYQPNSKGDTPLNIAARQGSLEILRELLASRWKNAESREVEEQNPLLRMLNLEKDTVLHDAVRNGHFEIVKLLIIEDSELTNFINDNGESPLFLAVDRKHFSMAKHILEVAPRCSYWGRKNRNVLHAAIIRHCHSSILSPFLNTHIAMPISCLVYSCIKIACTRSKELDSSEEAIGFMTAFILKFPTAITKADDLGWTPLHYASYLGYTEVVRLLLENDNDRHVAYMKDNKGMSALHIAAKEGHKFVIEQLIKFYPETCLLLDKRGMTALHVAIESGKAHVVKYILKTPVLEGLINEQDKEGNTPLHLAVVHRHLNIIRILANDIRVDKGAIKKEGFAAIDIIPSDTEISIISCYFKYWIKVKLEGVGAPCHNGRAVTREKTKTKNVEMKEQPQHIERREEHTNDQEKEDLKIQRLKEMGHVHFLVATFVATVNFAACFQMPGGYESGGVNHGMAVLRQKPAFKEFVKANNLAFSFSALSISCHFSASLVGSIKKALPFYTFFLRLASAFTYLSILGMVWAFGTGISLVLSNPDKANSTVAR